MARQHTLGVIVGSLRKESFSRKIATYLATASPESLTPAFVEIGDLPIYNADFETDHPPRPWIDLREHVRKLSALLFVTPEYNRGLPAAMKNVIDVGSRPPGHNVWAGKPAGVVSVTPGALGAMASHHQLRQALFAVGVAAMPKPEIYIARVNTLLAPDGTITDDKTGEILTGYMKSLAAWTERILADIPTSPDES